MPSKVPDLDLYDPDRRSAHPLSHLELCELQHRLEKAENGDKKQATNLRQRSLRLLRRLLENIRELEDIDDIPF